MNRSKEQRTNQTKISRCLLGFFAGAAIGATLARPIRPLAPILLNITFFTWLIQNADYKNRVKDALNQINNRSQI